MLEDGGVNQDLILIFCVNLKTDWDSFEALPALWMCQLMVILKHFQSIWRELFWEQLDTSRNRAPDFEYLEEIVSNLSLIVEIQE